MSFGNHGVLGGPKRTKSANKKTKTAVIKVPLEPTVVIVKHKKEDVSYVLEIPKEPKKLEPIVKEPIVEEIVEKTAEIPEVIEEQVVLQAPAPKEFKCEICGYIYKAEWRLRRHMDLKHPTEVSLPDLE